MQNDRTMFAHLLRYALLEIRSLDGEKTQRSRDLADIFHNIPIALVDENADWDKTVSVFDSRVKYYGLSTYVENLKKHVVRIGNS
jgi:hypothetical protein